jgi:hypothetical protein
MSKKSTLLRVAGFIGAAGVTAALVGSAVAGSGAYFSDSKPGSVSATMGSIKVNTDHTTLSLQNLLPGEAQSQTASFVNSGLNAQDVWVVFDNADLGDHSSGTDTGLINDRGQFGQAEITSQGVTKFWSNNLNDDSSTCAPGTGAPAVCNPVPHMLKLQDNLAPGASADLTFTYTPAAKTKGLAWEGNPAFAPIDYQIVATQHGITPDNSLNTVPVP